MPVLYLLTAPEPAVAGTDAVFQEVAALQEAFGGAKLNHNPRKRPGSPYPPQLFGLHNLLAIKRAEQCCRLNHLYHSTPYYFPVLGLLRNPVVLTVVAGLKGRKPPRNLRALKKLHRIVVSNARDADQLAAWGLTNSAIVPPGIDVSRLSPVSLSMTDKVTLLMASAPWTEEQFDSKGIDVLLDVAARNDSLSLILLWRGRLIDQLRDRIVRHGIGDRVEVVTHRVNVDDYLRRAHAAVLLAKRGDIVKAYPHSLIESLVAGKPVILSDALPMADYVRQERCGIVIHEVSSEMLMAAIETLKRGYDDLAHKARSIGSHAFSQRVMIDSYRDLYGL
jgi:glycosyltransferase involved in cell wall biosynthesis